MGQKKKNLWKKPLAQGLSQNNFINSQQQD